MVAPLTQRHGVQLFADVNGTNYFRGAAFGADSDDVPAAVTTLAHNGGV